MLTLVRLHNHARLLRRHPPHLRHVFDNDGLDQERQLSLAVFGPPDTSRQHQTWFCQSWGGLV